TSLQRIAGSWPGRPGQEIQPADRSGRTRRRNPDRGRSSQWCHTSACRHCREERRLAQLGLFLPAPGKTAVAGVTSNIPFTSPDRAKVPRSIQHLPDSSAKWAENGSYWGSPPVSEVTESHSRPTIDI